MFLRFQARVLIFSHVSCFWPLIFNHLRTIFHLFHFSPLFFIFATKNHLEKTPNLRQNPTSVNHKPKKLTIATPNASTRLRNCTDITITSQSIKLMTAIDRTRL